jgi:two-component system, chemotaxis family, chemotaxis protein CheY
MTLTGGAQLDTSLSNKTAMIIDDELFFREVLRDILTKGGFTVVAEVADGSEAAAKYRIHRPAITIMDIFMPGKNGIEATQEIVAFDKDAKVLICSGVGFDEDIEAAYQAGARGVILKPLIPAEIMETINKVLGST